MEFRGPVPNPVNKQTPTPAAELEATHTWASRISTQTGKGRMLAYPESAWVPDDVSGPFAGPITSRLDFESLK